MSKVFMHLLDRYKDTDVVLVDEYQCVETRLWPYFQYLYSRGVRFRFCGDEDQINSIEDSSWSVKYFPFMGKRINMVRDVRNDVSLIQLREAILEHRVEIGIHVSPDAMRGIEEPIRHAINLAYRRPVVEIINRRYVLQHGLRWGDDGRYVAMRKGSGFQKGEVWIRTGDMMTCGSMTKTVSLNEMESLRDRELLHWGWAVTVHKMIGETITDPFTIWDVDFSCHLPGYTAILYTAITRGVSLEFIEFRPPMPMYPIDQR